MEVIDSLVRITVPYFTQIMKRIIYLFLVFAPIIGYPQQSRNNLSPSDYLWMNVGNAGFSEGEVEFTDIAFDSTGIPYIAFRDFSNSQKASVMKFDGTSWIYVGEPGISPGGALDVCLAMSPTGEPHVSFTDLNTGRGMVMKFSGNTWYCVGGYIYPYCAVNFSRMTFSPSGQLYFIYSDPGLDWKAVVKKLNASGTSWDNVGIEGFSAGAAQEICIACSPDNQPYVAFRDEGYSWKIVVMKFDGVSWVSVGSPGFSLLMAASISLAISLSGEPYVAFRDEGNSLLTSVKRFDETNWVDVGTPGTTFGSAYYPDLGFSPEGQLYFAYSVGRANVKKFDGSEWVVVGTPDFSEFNAYYTSLAFNPIDSLPYVAFRDYDNFDKATVMKFDSCTVGPAGPITGPEQVCQGSSGYLYSVSPIPNATNYSWSVPFGAEITSGAGTNAITVSYTPYAFSGSISVYASQPCSGASSQIEVNVITASTPVIVGSDSLCINSGYYFYSTEAGMNNYQWNISTGGSIISGQESSVVQVVWHQMGDEWISVSYMNAFGCPAITPTAFPVTVNPLPDSSGTITGQSIVCAGSNSIGYSVMPIPNTTTYIWNLPVGVTIASGSITNAIIVNFDNAASSGNATVYGNNLCGDGTISLPLYINVNPIPVTPTITASGGTLLSSASIGNQWYCNSVLLVNDTNQTYIVNPYLSGYFWTQVNLEGCSSDTSNHIYYSTVGINEVMTSKLLLFPNPVFTNLTIDFSNVPGIFKFIEIYEPKGGKTFETQTDKDKLVLNVDNYPSGIYVVKVRTNTSNFIGKFCKY